MFPGCALNVHGSEWGGGGFLPIIMLLPNYVEAELGCDNSFTLTTTSMSVSDKLSDIDQRALLRYYSKEER